MIERQTIGGREATVAYFDEQFQPVDDLTQPYIAKVLFDDGEVLTLRSPVVTPISPRTKILGYTLAEWARQIAADDEKRIQTAISVGLTSGDENTDIAHRVIGNRRMNGVDGVTEITRQQILRLGRAFLSERKSRMAGSSTL